MLRAMHLIVIEAQEPFEPEAGAYAAWTGHGHGTITAASTAMTTTTVTHDHDAASSRHDDH